MTMIRQVARALWSQVDARPGALRDLTFDEMWAYPTGREWLEALARRAIEAMREPTEAMIQAGYDWQCADWPANWSNDGATPELYTATHLWPAMIDAALGEP